MSTRVSVSASVVALVLTGLASTLGCSADSSGDAPAATSEDELAETTYLLGAWSVEDNAMQGGLVASYERRGARATDLAMFTKEQQRTIQTSGTYLLRHTTAGSKHGRFITYDTSTVLGGEGNASGRVKFVPITGPNEPAQRAYDCHFAMSAVSGEGVFLSLTQCTFPELEMQLRASTYTASATALTSFGYCYAERDCYEQGNVLPSTRNPYFNELTPAVQSLLTDWRTSYDAWNRVGAVNPYAPTMHFACSSQHTCSVRR
jgi:hypothetical protein